MPIRIKLFLIILCSSLIPLFLLMMIIPTFPQLLFTIAGTSFFLMSFVIIVIITFISLIVAIHVSLPLTYLREIARKVQEGDLNQRVIIKGHDEIGELARVFNTMLDNLQNQQVNLQNTVTNATKELNEKVITLEDTKKASLNLLEDLEEEKGKLDEARSKDEAILASIGDGLMIVDEEGKVIFVNKVAEKMLGWNRDELIGKLWYKIIPLLDEKDNIIPESKRPLQQALSYSKSTTTTTTTYFYVRKDKTKFPVQITATQVILQGKVIGAIEVFRDITREQEIDKAKSEFVSLASHQLRTPLGISKWYLEVLKNDDYLKQAPPKQQDYLNEVYKSNERLIHLVSDLLSVARIDQGRIKDSPEPTDIKKLLEEIIKQMQIISLQKKTTLKLIVKSQNIPNLSINPLQLHEVIENLIINALEYTPSSGSVEVTLATKETDVCIEVKDTGIGISTEDKKKLFNKFFRSSEAVSSNAEGSGLGLYVVKSYIDHWGGTIGVDSEKGKGSKFTICLPISKKS